MNSTNDSSNCYVFCSFILICCRVFTQTVESTKSGKGAEKSVKKEVPKAKDPLSAGFIDPLTSAIVDPLSVSDPLSAALFKPTQPAETDPSSSTHKVTTRWSARI